MKQVHQRTSREQQIWQQRSDVPAMISKKEIGQSGGETEEGVPPRNVEAIATANSRVIV
jgi:hypothetical protein